jgi:hypothetical protein
MKFSDGALYACGLEGGKVAGHVRWDKASSRITWLMPGGRQRAYSIKRVLEETDTELTFLDSQNRRFTLTPLTPSRYNAEIRSPRDRELGTDAELLEAFTQSLA